MGPKRLKRATAVRFWCSWYPTQYFWIRPVILDRFQGPGRSFSDQKLGLKSKSGFSGHPRYLRPKLRTSDQNALKQTGSEGPQNLSMGFWHVKHQFYLPAQKCSNLTHPSVHYKSATCLHTQFGLAVSTMNKDRVSSIDHNFRDNTL